VGHTSCQSVKRAHDGSLSPGGALDSVCLQDSRGRRNVVGPNRDIYSELFLNVTNSFSNFTFKLNDGTEKKIYQLELRQYNNKR